MPELRHDPIQRRWVIIATERAKRPSDFTGTLDETPNGNFCPFCEGNEHTTPPEVFAYRLNGSQPNQPGWTVRVVSNKFPALCIEGDLCREGEGIFDKMNGVGAHEVVIETTDHNLHLADQSLEHLELVIRAYQHRLNDLMGDPRFRYVLIFKNYGVTAGASLAHPHTQLIATPITPRTISMELDSAREHYLRKERCLFCDIIRQELKDGSRVIARNEDFIALCPYASRFPFEVLIAPLTHHHTFADISEDQIKSLSRIMKDMLTRLKVSLNDPPYNFVFHVAPNTRAQAKRPGYWVTLEQDWHWHIEIMPRLTRVAGFEWGTGFYINPVPPEDAARYLREV
ncbi:MAG: galactose-1-phosphate uridylyltransferase [Anaerolineae bacterium]|jgi:UDPglucose--hexose-1-phosphate uridylyltransferase|nr:galactose-1-phosphate uridylyltransferase [Anaerolineae bacterium]MDH7475108.1 galactose-1-phosphate uridylyltransferase [Anaerolineae bacterium]